MKHLKCSDKKGINELAFPFICMFVYTKDYQESEKKGNSKKIKPKGCEKGIKDNDAWISIFCSKHILTQLGNTRNEL